MNKNLLDPIEMILKKKTKNYKSIRANENFKMLSFVSYYCLYDS